jgi:hypothetical protein
VVKNQKIIQKLHYSYLGHSEVDTLPLPLRDSLALISDFFAISRTNKLCLVFPSKEFAAQWLSVPTVLLQIKSDFTQFKNEIVESYKSFKSGDKLLLNNDAVVEWICVRSVDKNGRPKKVAVFRTKSTKVSSSLEISIPFEKITKLQRTNKKILSSQKKVMSVLPKRNITPLEHLLEVETFGNQEFIKNRVCLVTRYKSFDDSTFDVSINAAKLTDYFHIGKIDENGKANESGPFLITNNFSNLILYLADSAPVSKIIIDGFGAVTPKGDFSEIDKDFKIPTILITDLTEIETFSEIKNHGFEFFNFTKENVIVRENSSSPFKNFQRKLNKYISFRFEREVCNNIELESISKKLHSLTKDDSDENLNILRISLIQVSNLLSRICYVPSKDEMANFNEKIEKIESHFINCQLWLGESLKPIEETISLLKFFVAQLANKKTEKCIRLEELLKHCYDYIICPSEDEVVSLRRHFHNTTTKIISVADLNDNILSGEPVKAILTGWPKSLNMNRILFSFLFSELKVLFYQYENVYYSSLQRRNKQNYESIKPIIGKNGTLPAEDQAQPIEFEDLFTEIEILDTTSDSPFDVVEFELKLDNIQYSKYAGKGNVADSCKARRIDFENNTFIYATESHKFPVINELFDSAKSNPNIHGKKIDSLQTGDVLSFINTVRDILAEQVEKSTKPSELEKIKGWTELWKTLLRDYFSSIGNDFKKLVENLREFECKKHPATIKHWLQDDNLIGPDSNDDLRSIAMISNSELLMENIDVVREAIEQMTSWRFQAATIVRDKIRNKLLDIAEPAIINTSIEIPDLGRVEILKISELNNETEEIDKKFVHRLIAKEVI